MNNFVTVFFYLFLLLLCTLLAFYANKKKSKILLCALIGILSLVAGLRHYSVGFDTEPYMLGIENFFNTKKIMWPYTSFSLGYGYFTYFIYLIYHNFNFLLLIEALIINSFIILRFWDFREKSSFPLVIFLYLIIIYLRTFNLNVQYIAIAIVFYGTRFLDKNKPLVFFIFVAIASCIHISALVGILYFFLNILVINKMTSKNLLIQIISFILIVVAFKYGYTLFADRYAQYSTKTSSIGLMSFAQMFVFFITYILALKVFKNNNDDVMPLYKKISLYYLCGIILSFSSYFIGNAGRISYYYMIFEPIYFGIIQKSNKFSMGYKMMLITWLVFYAFYVIVDGLSGTNYFPYNFFWMK